MRHLPVGDRAADPARPDTAYHRDVDRDIAAPQLDAVLGDEGQGPRFIGAFDGARCV